MKKVLIIGASGMMGSKIVPLLLEKGYAVDGVSLDDLTSDNPNLRYFKLDGCDKAVLDELLKNNYDGVIDFLHHGDVEQSKKRLQLFLDNTKHYIFLSSYRVYADNDGEILENSPRLPEAYPDDEFLMTKDFYGVSKSRSEDFLNQSGYKNYTIVRPVVVYAENCVLLVTWKNRNIPYLASKGKKLVLPIQAKDKNACIIYSGDIAKYFANLLFNEKAYGQSFTLGNPEKITWGELAKLYKELCGIDYEWVDGEKFAQIVTGKEQIPDGWRTMLFYDRFFNRNVCVDKVLSVCGMSADQLISHKDGIKKCLDAFPKDYTPNAYDLEQEKFLDKYFNNNF